MRIIKCKICGKEINIAPTKNRTQYCLLCKQSKDKDLQRTYSKKHYLLNKDKYVQKAKEWKNNNSQKAKELQRKSTIKNKEKINFRQRIIQSKRRKELADVYIRTNLRNNSYVPISNPSQELIEFTREHIRLKRLIKELTKIKPI